MNEKIELLDRIYSHLGVRFDSERGVLWTTLKQNAVPCVTSKLLDEIADHQRAIQSSQGNISVDGAFKSVRYSVLASSTPGVFNLGGNLSLFSNLIQKQDRSRLMQYAAACIDVIHQRSQHFNLPLTTITLLQGTAFGGGLEAALTSDIIIAERGVRLGFPEIMFNLFPGMGAYSLLSRKISPRFAEKMILSGEMYTAEEMFDAGLVDILVDVGQGQEAVNDFVKKQERYRNGFVAVRKAAQVSSQVTYRELIDITTIWVDAVLNLNDRDLRMMDRFARSQEKQFLQPQAA